MKRNKRHTVASGVSYFVITMWCIFLLYLFAWTLAASLSTTKELFTGKLMNSGLNYKNYIDAIKNNPVILYLSNSLIYSVFSCFFVIIIAAPCAYALARYSFKWNKFLQNMFTAGIGIPLIMVILPLFYIASRLQMTNSKILLIIIYTGINVPFTVFFLIMFFLNIPSALEEAAFIDGCSNIKAFWKIVLPLAQPGIITVTIFNFISIWNEYFVGLIFASKSELRPLSVGIVSMINTMKYSGNWAGMFAILVIAFIPSIILYVILSERIIAGITGGAIKG